jgi:selenocysteine lyase/cysteine desulfurase
MNKMGCANVWEHYKDHFPVTRNLTYLNHAAVAPIVKSSYEAMRDLAADACDYGSFHYSQWLAAYEGLREETAKLINGLRGEIAIVKNTSEGIATVALGIDWRPGDVVVAFREEFPANYYPWHRLASKRVEIRWLSIEDPLDRIEEACRGARLLAISHVNYLTGYRVDIEAIGQICHRHGCLFFVDAIQGMGVYPIDVRRMKIHALAADGHKWLLGPEGCGVLYIQQDVQDLIEPVEFGWTNVAKYADYASRDMTLRPDAGRYECGTLNTIGIFGLRASIAFLNQVGTDVIQPAVDHLAERIAAGAQAKGYELAAARAGDHGSGIVSFRKEGVDSGALVAKLREARIITAPRQGWVRTSPHFYINPEEVDRMLELLP